MTGYGLIVGVATVVWWSVVEYLEPRSKKIIPWVLLAALVGARMYHVVDEWEYYVQDYQRIWQVWNGGLSIWGAILGGGMIVLLGIRKQEAGIRNSIISAMVTPLPLAQAIGRIANGINGEFTNKVLGIPWWGMEAILDLILFVIIWKWRRVELYVIGYLLIRLVLQPYRL